MGLGAWQATCSVLGSFRKWLTTLQNRLPSVSPCLKSNAPGPGREEAGLGECHELVPQVGGAQCSRGYSATTQDTVPVINMCG